MPPVSFTHMEMIRAGVPTYAFDGKIKFPDRLLSIAKTIWNKESIDVYTNKFVPDRSYCNVKVDQDFMTRNFCDRIGYKNEK